jgi:hypothetical protein
MYEIELMKCELKLKEILLIVEERWLNQLKYLNFLSQSETKNEYLLAAILKDKSINGYASDLHRKIINSIDELNVHINQIRDLENINQSDFQSLINNIHIALESIKAMDVNFDKYLTFTIDKSKKLLKNKLSI